MVRERVLREVRLTCQEVVSGGVRARRWYQEETSVRARFVSKAGVAIP